eukprot:g15964.t1
MRVNSDIPAEHAAGCAEARSHLMPLYKQDPVPYFLLTDPHVYFTHHWDVLLVNMVEGVNMDDGKTPLRTATSEEMMNMPLEVGVLPKNFNPSKSVFTSYPEDKHTPERNAGDIAKDRVPVINRVYYTDEKTIMQASVGCEIAPGTYAASRTLGGGMLIMPGKALLDVPLDTNLRGLHQGEEILWAARLWTSGYDLYAPPYNLLAHDYNRKPGSTPVLPSTPEMQRNDARAKNKVMTIRG